MSEFYSQLWGHLCSPSRIVTVVSVAILLGITGPFGTFVSLNIFERLVYWSAVVLISTVFVHVVKVVIDLKFPKSRLVEKGIGLCRHADGNIGACP